MASQPDPSNPADFDEIGVSHHAKIGWWSSYVTANTLGVLFCSFLLFTVTRLPKRAASDIFAAALCFSCLIFSLGCAIQCFINAINGGFAYGESACYAEAFIHLTSMITMFALLALMAMDSHRTVVTGKSVGVKKALQLVAATWVFSATGVGLFSLDSPIYLVPTGVFCFYAFDSIMAYGFFLPCGVIAAAIMIYYYARIFSLTRKAMAQMNGLVSNGEERKKKQMRLAQKLFLFVIVFVVSWAPAFGCVISILVTNSTHGMDGPAALLVCIHSIIVPLTYGLINPRLREAMLKMIGRGQLNTGSTTELGRKTGPETLVSSIRTVTAQPMPRSPEPPSHVLTPTHGKSAYLVLESPIDLESPPPTAAWQEDTADQEV